MYNPTTPGSPVRHFRRAGFAPIYVVGAKPRHADPTVMGHPAAEPRTSPCGRRFGAPIAPASSRCLLLSRSQSCLCTRMPPRSLRFTLCSLPSCADSHASDENPEVHQLSCDGPVAFEQNICPRLSANGRFLRVNIRPSGATITWVALSALHVTLPLARLYCRPHTISKML